MPRVIGLSMKLAFHGEASRNEGLGTHGGALIFTEMGFMKGEREPIFTMRARNNESLVAAFEKWDSQIPFLGMTGLVMSERGQRSRKEGDK
jgi:hypothetical protein